MSDLAKDEIRDAMRRKVFKENIPGFATQRGLEIGALCSPCLPKKRPISSIMTFFPKKN